MVGDGSLIFNNKRNVSVNKVNLIMTSTVVFGL